MFTDLYTIKNSQVSDEQLQVDITLNADHAIFLGHFPGQPVLPGVCQLAIAKQLAEGHLKKSLRMEKSSQIKFLAMIDPRKTPDLHFQLSITTNEQGYSIQTNISHGDLVFLKSKALFVHA